MINLINFGLISNSLIPFRPNHMFPDIWCLYFVVFKETTVETALNVMKRIFWSQNCRLTVHTVKSRFRSSWFLSFPSLLSLIFHTQTHTFTWIKPHFIPKPGFIPQDQGPSRGRETALDCNCNYSALIKTLDNS